jgi:UDP-2-acetamido-2,6-beta-L-arabino-hexul-4-ose reductase
VHISAVANLLDQQLSSYRSGVLPTMDNRFEWALFNTLRFSMFPAAYPLPLERKTDNRGHLVETVKASSGGQSFVSSTHPGITRGNHYHRRKFERFLVLAGTADISLRRLFSPDVVSFTVSGEQPSPIDMPTLHTHNITNIGDTELITMFWTNEIFDPNRPDTYALMVTPTQGVSA